MIISSLTKAPYVVTANDSFKTALALAEPKKGELIYDLGCGDARVLIYATDRYQTRGLGYDISPFCVFKSRLKVLFAGYKELITIEKQSLFKADLSKADVIFLYSGSRIMNELEPEIFRHIKSSARIVSLAFPFSNHKPKKIATTKQLGKETSVFLYTK